jgi:hypothetical protein
MADLNPYATCSLSDRLELLAFEAELAHLPRALIAALWTARDRLPASITGNQIIVQLTVPGTNLSVDEITKRTADELERRKMGTLGMATPP